MFSRKKPHISASTQQAKAVGRVTEGRFSAKSVHSTAENGGGADKKRPNPGGYAPKARGGNAPLMRDEELADLLKRVRRLEMRARKEVGDLSAGAYRSRFRGQGMEFDRVREYAQGDDIRNIDWNVSARAGRPFIKIFQEERELSIMLLVDCSGSMSFGGIKPWSERSKAFTATEAAAIIAITALRNSDRVGLIAFSDQTELHLPARRGRNHTLRLVRELLGIQDRRRATNVPHALEEIRHVHKRRAVVFVISDFMDPHPDLGSALQQAKRKHDVIGIRITDPAELDLPASGAPLVLRDPEGNGNRVFKGGRRARARYKALIADHRETVEMAFRSAGADLIDCSTDEHAFSAVQRFFRQRSRK